VNLSWIENVCSRPLCGVHLGISTTKVGHSDLFLVCNHGLIVGLCMQDYKSLCAAVMTCATLVNIQKHRQTSFDQLI